MKKQYAKDIAEEYQWDYERRTHGLCDVPFGAALDEAINEIDRIDTLADLWFGAASDLERLRKQRGLGR